MLKNSQLLLFRLLVPLVPLVMGWLSGCSPSEESLWVHLAASDAPDPGGMLRRSVSFSTDKAEAVLGYRPRFPLSEAVALSVAWLRHNGFVRSA